MEDESQISGEPMGMTGILTLIYIWIRKQKGRISGELIGMTTVLDAHIYLVIWIRKKKKVGPVGSLWV